MKPSPDPAVTLGSVPDTRVGLLMMVPGAYEDWVAIEDVEFERVGEDGRIVGPWGGGGGDGATDIFDEVR